MGERQMHGYDAVFVPALELKYTCPVCLTALRNPVQTTCGHRFCKACLLTSFGNRKKGRCPVDKKICNVSSDVFLDNAVKREVLSLSVKCQNFEKDCDWHGELRDLEKHMDKCPQSEVNCEMCNSVMVRMDLPEHVLSCPHRLQNCSHCAMPIVFVDMPKHQLLVCSKFPVNCVVCGATDILREDIARHVDLIEGDCPLVTVPCKFNHIGCYFQDKRKNMLSHYESAGEHHLMLLSMKVAQNEEVITQQDDRIRRISTEICDLRDTLYRHNRVIEAQEELLAIQESKIAEYQSNNYNTGNILWKVSINSHRDHQVSSPSFYTASGGYKVRVIIDLKGHSENKKTYASLLLRLETGKYDDQLNFPFEGRCTVSLLDQNMESTNTVSFKCHSFTEDNEIEDSVVVGRKHNYIQISELMRERYVRSGCFLLDVKVFHFVSSC